MKRLLWTLYTDLRLQFRNGFPYATAVAATLSILALRQLDGRGLDWLLPIMLLINLITNSFYFVGGLVLLEKGEGTLQAQVITPLRRHEYLASKVISLSLLSLAESLAIVAFGRVPSYRLLPLAAGVVLAAALYVLGGFLVVSRYRSINEYLLPSTLYVAALSVPAIQYFGIGQGWWLYLHPIQAPLLLLQAAFAPLEPWQVVYGLAYGMAWTLLGFYVCRRAFQRFVVAAEG